MKRPSARKPRTAQTEETEKPKTQEVVETKPKKVQEKSDKDPKSKVETGDKKRKTPETKPDKTAKPGSETQTTKSNKRAKTDKQGHQSRTWAGRWIPTDEKGLERFNAIRNTFTEHISHKVKAPSSLQNAFFTLCNAAFSTLSNNAEKKEFEACAKLQVEKFLATEIVRT